MRHISLFHRRAIKIIVDELLFVIDPLQRAIDSPINRFPPPVYQFFIGSTETLASHKWTIRFGCT